MRLISTAPLALAVSRAGGIGFLGLGTDVSSLPTLLEECTASLEKDPIPNTLEGVLPIGIGVICVSKAIYLCFG
jgi:nitronate monooxygenase